MEQTSKPRSFVSRSLALILPYMIIVTILIVAIDYIFPSFDHPFWEGVIAGAIAMALLLTVLKNYVRKIEAWLDR